MGCRKMYRKYQTMNNTKALYTGLILVVVSVTLFPKICLGVDEAKRSTPPEQAPKVSREITKSEGQPQTLSEELKSENARAEKEGIGTIGKDNEDRQENVITQVLAAGINTEHAIKAIQMQADHAIEYFKNQADYVITYYGILYAALGFGIALVVSLVGAWGFRSVNQRFAELSDRFEKDWEKLRTDQRNELSVAQTVLTTEIGKVQTRAKEQVMQAERQMTDALTKMLDAAKEKAAEAENARAQKTRDDLSELKTDFSRDCRNLYDLANHYAVIFLIDYLTKLNVAQELSETQAAELTRNLSVLLLKTNRIIEVYKGRDNSMAAKAYALQGLVEKRLGKYVLALESLEKASDLAPEIAEYHYNTACYACLCGNVEKSLRYLQTAVRLDERYKSVAKDDQDFEKIRENPQFLEVTS